MKKHTFKLSVITLAILLPNISFAEICGIQPTTNFSGNKSLTINKGSAIHSLSKCTINTDANEFFPRAMIIDNKENFTIEQSDIRFNALNKRSTDLLNVNKSYLVLKDSKLLMTLPDKAFSRNIIIAKDSVIKLNNSELNLEITYEDYYLDKNIVSLDNSTLDVENSKLVISGIETNDNRRKPIFAEVLNGSNININQSVLSSNRAASLFWLAQGNATINDTNVEFPNKSVLFLYGKDNNNVTLNNSKLKSTYALGLMHNIEERHLLPFININLNNSEIDVDTIGSWKWGLNDVAFNLKDHSTLKGN